MNIGERLKETRLSKGLTLAEVGDRIGKTEATMQRYESGEIKNVKPSIVEDLAKIYKVSPAYLMGWENEDLLVDSHSYDYFPVPINEFCAENMFGERIEKITLPDSIMGCWANQNDIFFISVGDNSMDKIIPKDSLLGVKKISFSELRNDDIVIFSNEENKYMTRRLKMDLKQGLLIFRPESTNDLFIDCSILMNNYSSINLHGKVVVSITNYN